MKTQQVLILRHSKGSPPGSTIEWLQMNNLSYMVHDYETTPNTQPELEKFGSLIICGGGMNVDEEHLYPWMKDEKKLIEKAIQLKMPTIGLCLGAQLIAEVLGAEVGRHTATEAGWHRVQMNPFAHHFLAGTPTELQAFQWHSYAFQTPKTAVRFASNEMTENQGFIYEDHVFATQFHPETTAHWVQQCLADPEFPTGPHDQSPQVVLEGVKHQPELQNWYFHLLSRLILHK